MTDQQIKAIVVALQYFTPIHYRGDEVIVPKEMYHSPVWASENITPEALAQGLRNLNEILTKMQASDVVNHELHMRWIVYKDRNVDEMLYPRRG